MPAPPKITVPPRAAPPPAAGLAGIDRQQWRSGIAAWLGWLFDGLDMHLYTLVATPFVAELLGVGLRDPAVDYYGSIIQASFLLGWAIGGGFFGRLGDRLGRAQALVLTILTYAAFTGLSFFAQTWWQLMLCRFLAALGIGGEWAVGAALISETWPARWRPWLAATLQSAVNVGVVLAMAASYALASFPCRTVFLVGLLPALLVLWIRRAVPEPEEWRQARQTARPPRVAALFVGPVRRTTLLVIVVCALGLTAHWAFMFWSLQHLRKLPDLAAWSEAQRTQLVSVLMVVLMVASIGGNFLAAAVAKGLGYRRTIALGSLAYFLCLALAYGMPRPYTSMIGWLVLLGGCSGLFGLYTMYLPPLFPTLLRTTGAGFCYNIGRVVAAAGTVFFGLFNRLGDPRPALFYASFLFLPAALVALALPEPEES